MYIFNLILIPFLASCSNIKSIKEISINNVVFDDKKSSKILYDTYRNFRKNKMFFLPKYQNKTIKYFNKTSIFYDVEKDYTYTFSNQISKDKAEKLKIDYSKKLDLNMLVDKYVYKVSYNNDILVHSSSRNEELFFDNKGRIIVSIYHSMVGIRFIYYSLNNIDVVDCIAERKSCQLSNYTYMEYGQHEKVEYQAGVTKNINKKSTYKFNDKNNVYQVECNELDKTCNILLVKK